MLSTNRDENGKIILGGGESKYPHVSDEDMALINETAPPPKKKRKTKSKASQKLVSTRLNFEPIVTPEVVEKHLKEANRIVQIGRTNRFIEWKDGVPVPVSKPTLKQESIKSLSLVALSLPYEGYIDPETGENVIEPDFIGMTNAEVMYVKLGNRAAHGDLQAAEFLLDRILGRPKQHNENVSMKMSYQEFLEYLSNQPDEASPQNPASSSPENYNQDTIDVEVSTSRQSSDDDYLDSVLFPD